MQVVAQEMPGLAGGGSLPYTNGAGLSPASSDGATSGHANGFTAPSSALKAEINGDVEGEHMNGKTKQRRNK